MEITLAHIEKRGNYPTGLFEHIHITLRSNPAPQFIWGNTPIHNMPIYSVIGVIDKIKIYTEDARKTVRLLKLKSGKVIYFGDMIEYGLDYIVKGVLKCEKVPQAMSSQLNIIRHYYDNIYEMVEQKGLTCFGNRTVYDTALHSSVIFDSYEYLDDEFSIRTAEEKPFWAPDSVSPGLDQFYFIRYPLSDLDRDIKHHRAMKSQPIEKLNPTGTFKIHLSVKIDYVFDALMKFLEFQEQNPEHCFDSFKIFRTGVKHIDYKTTDIQKYFINYNKENIQDKLDEYFFNIGSTGSANIVIYSNSELNSGNHFKESLRILIDFWKDVENETDPEGIRIGDKWRRSHNYLLFNFKAIDCDTLFFACGFDTKKRLDLYDRWVNEDYVPDYYNYTLLQMNNRNTIYRSNIINDERDELCTLFSRGRHEKCVLKKYGIDLSTLCNDHRIANIYSSTFFDNNARHIGIRKGINLADVFLEEFIDKCEPQISDRMQSDYLKYKIQVRRPVYDDQGGGYRKTKKRKKVKKRKTKKRKKVKKRKSKKGKKVNYHMD